MSLLLAGCTLGPSERPPLATFGAAPSTSTATVPESTPVGPGGTGRQADPIRWEPCSDVSPVDRESGLRFTVDCAAVLVDRTGVSFTDQAIHVARARAAGVAEDAPAVVVLSGPPGANGRDRVASVAAGLSEAVREHFAVVTVDLAGTGQSAPIDCLSGYDTASLASLGADPAAPGAATAIAELSRSLTFECGDLAGPELSLVNSTTAADDLDALRSALGQERLTLIGQGFGATLGAVYADRYPGRVEAAVLDAPNDPLDEMDVTATDVANSAELALDDFAARCPSFSGGCPLGADPRATVEQAISTLDARPGAGPGAGSTNGGSVLLTMLLTLGDPDSWPALASAIAAAADGNPAPIGQLLESALGLQQGSTWLNAAIIYGCNDGALRISPDQLSAAVEKARVTAPLFGPYTVGLTGLCSSWPAAEAALGAVKAAGAAPILVVGSVRDPLAPYEQVRSLSGQLASATLISWQSGRHGSYPASACVTAAVDAYLLKQELPGAGTLCPP
ncbi:alpha/beta hydrolase [Nakamurella sp. GG22]